MKTSVEKLIEIGCGKEMINCQIERGQVYAAIYNAKQELKYFVYAVKSNLYTKEQAIERMNVHLSSLEKVKPIAEKFHELYLQDFNAIQTKILNFIK